MPSIICSATVYRLSDRLLFIQLRLTIKLIPHRLGIVPFFLLLGHWKSWEPEECESSGMKGTFGSGSGSTDRPKIPLAYAASTPTDARCLYIRSTAQTTDQPLIKKLMGLTIPFRLSAGRNMRACLKISTPSPDGAFTYFPGEHGSPWYKPRSVSCCDFRPTKGTPAQAIPLDLDGFALSYRDSSDEFPPRWRTAKLQEPSTTRSLQLA